jgi:hypothetical protein
VRGVRGHVVEVDPEPDLCRLVADELAAAQRAADRVVVADVAAHVLDVDTGRLRVEDHRLMTARHQRLDDVRADEAGAAGDQDSCHRRHGRSPRHR